MIFRIYYEAVGDHVHMRFLAGKRDGVLRERVLRERGDLCMRLEEFDDFRVLTQHAQIEFRAEHRWTRASMDGGSVM